VTGTQPTAQALGTYDAAGLAAFLKARITQIGKRTGSRPGPKLLAGRISLHLLPAAGRAYDTRETNRAFGIGGELGIVHWADHRCAVAVAWERALTEALPQDPAGWALDGAELAAFRAGFWRRLGLVSPELSEQDLLCAFEAAAEQDDGDDPPLPKAQRRRGAA
jgi:hypothetical protein